MESSNQQPSPVSRTLPSREDCWSEEATSTLVDAWGSKYVELNRGNLRQKDWQDVADTVNAHHGHTLKSHRTDVQCKNRLDTLKKKFKTEKAKIAESNGMMTSSWPFFDRLEVLIGPSYHKIQSQKSTPIGLMDLPPIAIPLQSRKVPVQFSQFSPPTVKTPQLKLMPVILPQKRPLPVMDGSNFRRNYSAMAAAAAAKPVVELRGESSEEEVADEDHIGEEEGMRVLAKAIERFAEIYERVEGMKQKQMVELEKQRMQFVNEMEVQRMQLLMDTQVQLKKKT